MPEASTPNYTVHNLVSDNFVAGTVHDPNLVNGWGLTAGPATPWWVADNGTDSSTLYDGTGAPRPLVVAVHNAPTGAVFNGTSDFVVTSGAASGPARFIFATDWPGVPGIGVNASVVAGLGFDRDTLERIFWRNAFEVYNLGPPPAGWK